MVLAVVLVLLVLAAPVTLHLLLPVVAILLTALQQWLESLVHLGEGLRGVDEDSQFTKIWKEIYNNIEDPHIYIILSPLIMMICKAII